MLSDEQYGDLASKIGHVNAGLAKPLVERIASDAARAAEAEVANAFMAWAAKNEIAEPPLDWPWFGEIARRYSPLHGENQS